MNGAGQDKPPTAPEVLAALKLLAQARGWDAAWTLLPPSMALLASWLEGLDGLGPELATEVVVKVALHWQGEGE
jgi:hypothetical protein